MKIKDKQNAAWDELCAMVDKLAPQYGNSRVDAFEVACRQRPDLEAVAVDPLGAPVKSRPRPWGWQRRIGAKPRPAAQTALPPLAQLDALAKRMSREKHIAFHDAYSKVLATTEGAKLYDAYLAGRRNGRSK